MATLRGHVVGIHQSGSAKLAKFVGLRRSEVTPIRQRRRHVSSLLEMSEPIVPAAAPVRPPGHHPAESYIARLRARLEARGLLERLHQSGRTAEAFTFSTAFTSDGGPT